MSGFASLSTALSGMRAAQLGLSVTGHNLSNSEISGFSRQRVIQRDATYEKIGVTTYGTLKKGLGTDTSAIEQIRNQFLDLTYRTQNGKLSYYTIKSIAGGEIESLLGEMQGAYKFQDVVNDVWNALQALSAHPDGVETRDYFLATCSSFINKANEVYDSLFEYQHNLNQQIQDTVSNINQLVSRVNQLNRMITAAEASGDNANDYRDERNNCLDELSEIIPLDYYEDNSGVISIFSDGHQLLSQGTQNYMGLKYTSSAYSFVEPVFTNSKTILPFNTPPTEFESYMNYTRPITPSRNNDYGSLKGLMVARGAMPAFYNREENLWVPRRPSDIPIAPDETDVTVYPDGVNDPAYLADRLAYENELRNFQKLYPDYDPATYDPGDPDTFDPAAKKNTDAYAAAMYNYQYYRWSLDNCMIPKTMIALDSIVHSIVTLINDSVAPALNGVKDPEAPYDLYGDQSYVEIFTRKNMDRWNGDELIPEMQGNYYSQYSIGNIKLNPILLDTEGGYNYMAFSLSNDREDNTLLLNMLTMWSSNESPYSVVVNGVPYGVQNAYQMFVTELAVEIEEANNFVTNQTLQVIQADNQRYAVMGVSMDEEMSHMMKYQYAYNAAARVFNAIDSMLDKIINGML